MLDVVFLLQFFVAIFSLLAGGFWMASSTGHTIGTPWHEIRPVPPAGLIEHQAKWNARAALCASIAAICQALTFLADHYALLFFPNH